MSLLFKFHTDSTDLNRFITKTEKTLFECFGTLCLCSAIVMNLAVNKFPPSPCRYHNISFRYQSPQKKNTASLENQAFSLR